MKNRPEFSKFERVTSENHSHFSCHALYVWCVTETWFHEMCNGQHLMIKDVTITSFIRWIHHHITVQDTDVAHIRDTLPRANQRVNQ